VILNAGPTNRLLKGFDEKSIRWLGAVDDCAAAGIDTSANAARATGRMALRVMAIDVDMQTSVIFRTVCSPSVDGS
jgi:hypothetical protein